MLVSSHRLVVPVCYFSTGEMANIKYMGSASGANVPFDVLKGTVPCCPTMKNQLGGAEFLNQRWAGMRLVLV